MESISFDGTLGALSIGVTGCAFLFGVFTVQVYIYSRAYPSDSLLIKALVGIVFLCELGHTITTTHAGYLETIKKFGNPALLATMPNSLAISILFEGFITFMVEGFFTYRIYRMHRTPYVAYTCWLLATLRLCASTAFFVVGSLPLAHTELFTVFESKWSWLLEIIQIMGACIDVVIAAALCAYYLRNRVSTFSSTSRLIDKLLMWAISTGLITSLVSVLTLIFFLTMKQNFIWIVSYIWLAKVYSNSFLASLNARDGIRETGRHGVFLSGSSLPSKNLTQSTGTSPQSATQVNIDTDTFVLQDRSDVKDSDRTNKYPTLTGSIV
ncbi:hypothetical protein B0H17DRAFT_1215941 [Mycena rosella]|uniref:DUF6534 domain-containing protein n=1 Tax=Mycena rosella TaxID=1033263 RepID=A0AAD7CF18_MYCRO|nr:hypothetical protein B0H17DRAFT_1215941 [Mycena rosella]